MNKDTICQVKYAENVSVSIMYFFKNRKKNTKNQIIKGMYLYCQN